MKPYDEFYRSGLLHPSVVGVDLAWYFGIILLFNKMLGLLYRPMYSQSWVWLTLFYRGVKSTNKHPAHTHHWTKLNVDKTTTKHADVQRQNNPTKDWSASWMTRSLWKMIVDGPLWMRHELPGQSILWQNNSLTSSDWLLSVELAILIGCWCRRGYSDWLPDVGRATLIYDRKRKNTKP